MNLYERIRAAADGHEADPALRVPGGIVRTHGELHARVGALAARLAGLGVAAGDRVAVQVEKSVAAVELYLATLRCGGVFLPLNPAYTASEVGFFLGDAAPALFVRDPQRAGELDGVAAEAGVDVVRGLDGDGEGDLVAALDEAPLPVVARADDDLAAILYTSGTTGRSKGAMLGHGNLAANADTLRALWGWRPDDVLAHALPVHHVHGLFVALHCALLEPSEVIFLPRFDARAVVEALPAATVYMGVPTHYVRLLETDGLGSASAGMRLFVSGSAPLLPETFERFEAATGHRILERYGMTEAGMITSNPLDGPRVPGTVGPPLPDVEVRLRDDAGAPVAAGGVGVLQIRGPNVFAGYWGLPEKTAAEFDDGWFVTGDLATQDADGRVTIVGRAKDLIISGGLNVYPREVESVLDELPGVVESAVIGLPHPDFGEAVTAVLVTAGDWGGEAAVRAAAGEHLAGFKRPKRVLTVDALPRNTMGKVQKAELRRRYADLYADAGHSAPRSDALESDG
jgi:malonyl-CoA/methylmalonyl-CoA synthetase